MTPPKLAEQSTTLRLENIGGVDETEIGFEEGVTVLSGENASNRTSILEGLCTVLGGRNASVKSGKESGRTELTIDGESYTRELRRRESSVKYSGNPYLEDPTGAEHFAFLLEQNPARVAIRDQSNLREIVMEPVDITLHRERIEQLQEEKRQVDQKLEQEGTYRPKLKDQRQQRETLQEEIETLQTQLSNKEEQLREVASDSNFEVEITDDDIDIDTGDKVSDREKKFRELQEAREQLTQITQRISALEESLSSQREQRDKLQSELEELDPPNEERIDSIESEITSLQSELNSVESTLVDLRSVIQYNEDMLDDGAALSRSLESNLRNARADLSQTSDENEEGGLRCLLCGSSTSKEELKQTVEVLRSYHQEKRQEKQEIEDEISELEAEKNELQGRREDAQETQQQLESLTDDISRKEEELEEFREKQDEREERVETLEKEVKELQETNQDELLSLQETVTELQTQIESKESEISEIEANIHELEEKLEEIPHLKEEREELSEQLAEERDFVKSVQIDMVETFNDEIETLTERLSFENIERIWLERIEGGGDSSAEDATFEIHIARTDETGSVHEGDLENLSESERELTGIVFALAGYLAHDIASEMPFLILDSVEALDAERIATLIDYISHHTEYLVAALLLEDTQFISDEHRIITEY